MICVFGILKTKEGLRIKDEMLKWLNPLYEVMCIEQDPPGVLFEYPAIKYALMASIDLNEPVLYVHTKGASNTGIWYQAAVRNVWKELFGDEAKANAIYKELNESKEPLVICPFTGNTKITWFNGFMFNPRAAKIILENLKKPSECNRYYYECVANVEGVNVKGKLNNDCHNADDVRAVMREMMKT